MPGRRKIDQMAFQSRADLQNHAIGWLQRGYSSLDGGNADTISTDLAVIWGMSDKTVAPQRGTEKKVCRDSCNVPAEAMSCLAQLIFNFGKRGD